MKKEDLLQPIGKVPSRHITSPQPKYDPDGHLTRRDKDEEDLEQLLIDLVRTEIKKYFQK